MSQVQLQGIARCLSAAGYAERLTNQSVYTLHVETVDNTNYSLISKHWTGYSIESQEFIHKPVRRDTTAAYFITSIPQCIVCLSPSSVIRVLEYSTDEEGWVISRIPNYTVHHNGKFAACMVERGQLHVFFQNPAGKLIHLDNRNKTLFTLPGQPTVGSPMFASVFDAKIHVFYVSRDQRIHYTVVVPGKTPKDYNLSKLRLTEGLSQFTVTSTLIKGKPSFSACVLTEGRELLRISGDGKRAVLGTMNAAGEVLSGMQVDRCCAEAWDGSLIADHLKGYMHGDPYFINSPGGEHEITPLAAACWKGHLDVVQLLIDHGADPNALSPGNRTPLFYATTRAPPENRSNIVRALLRAGAEVDRCYAENKFNTPLMDAITLFRDKDVVRELLAHGASLTIQNEEGRTAGMLAKGAGLDKELPQLRQRPLVDYPLDLLLSPPPPSLPHLSQPHLPPPNLPPPHLPPPHLPIPHPQSHPSPPRQSPPPLSPPPTAHTPSSYSHPPQSYPEFSDTQKRRLIEFLVSMLMLIVAYTNTEDILDEVLRGRGGAGRTTNEG